MPLTPFTVGHGAIAGGQNGPFQLQEPFTATKSSDWDLETHPITVSPTTASQTSLPYDFAGCDMRVTKGLQGSMVIAADAQLPEHGGPVPPPPGWPRVGVPALGGRGHHSRWEVQGAISQGELLGSLSLA